ncbi:hypothetical protein LAZ67_1001422 [Cordylochernes scorpioides]|uniref:Uncharacterized protein n=1 Tax=Cordylochernes scorpioides TaxID=51811 RepID=A0ABY6JVJ0_9ARAC|nr:hypothetical protein LAZ67_1001422 [Cordylochernes scorpioides]
MKMSKSSISTIWGKKEDYKKKMLQRGINPNYCRYRQCHYPLLEALYTCVWESVSKEERSVDNLTQRLRLLEIKIQQRDECSASSSTALMANAYENKQNMKGKVTKSNENFQKTRETRECYFCHRKGHLAKDCRYAKQKKLKDKEKDETKLKPNSKLSESLISERFNEQDEDIWIGDSGATNHITRNASFYTSYKDFPTQQTVKNGSNEKLIAYGSGTITIETCVKGFEMKMDKKGCKIFKTTTGEVIVEGKRLPGGLYGMLITSIKPENAAEVNLAKTQNVNMLQLWHERFGHQNKRHFQKWLKEQGIDAVMDNEPCEACIYGKQHRLSFGSREQYASTQPGNLIHVDVCGPMQEVSKGGMRYFVCFKDDFTKYRSVYFLKEKSQVIEKLEQFLLETKTTGHIVKEILTDGGKEFVNKETSKITNKYGINHRITMPYTPQQNGSAERENRTLIEAARSMIYAKNMSLKLWAEAVNTATYVLNRTGPTQIEGKTPYELWFDKKPAVDHLRIFGTECFVHVPDENRRKLDAKSEKGILVGYCSNKDGYRIWMPNSNKVVTSRDVIFKETIPTFSLDIEKRNKELSSNQIDEQNDTQDIEKIESNVQTSDVYNLRDRSNISKPQRYIDAEINIAEGLEPKTYKEAMDSPNAQFWKEAMNEEMNSLTENDVYECTTLPLGQKPIDCKWVLKTKLNSKGEITRYKARLVAKGFAQKKGIDYEETFSPVARHDTIRTLLAIAANEDLKLVQFDIKTAFLYGDLQDQIYIKQPEGFNNGTDLVWKLKKSLYGLKQSPRCWNQKIVNFMKERCLKESTADPCLFFRKTNDHLLIIAIYVDDGIIAGTNEQEIKEFLDELMFSFKITSEPLNYFLGIEIEWQPDGSIFINQKAYIKRILEKFNMSQANKVGTPTDNSTVPGEAEILENVPFREAIGSLMHLSCLTRPDITFALNKVSQKLAAPTKYDWEAVKRIFKYLVGTTEYGIMYQKGHKVGVLESFSDADFAGDPETRRSTSGVVCKLAGGAISWLSQKQRSVSLSTTEAELVAASNTAKEVIWLNRLFSEISPLKEQPIIKVDNASTLKLIKNPEFHKRTKHIEVRHYFVREKYQEAIDISFGVIYCFSCEDYIYDKELEEIARRQKVKAAKSLVAPGISILGKRIMFPGKVAVFDVDVQGQRTKFINCHLSHLPDERLQQLQSIRTAAINENSWILEDFNISEENARDVASGSVEALIELLDLANLVDSAAIFNVDHQPTRISNYGNHLDSSRLNLALLPSNLSDRATCYWTLHYKNSDHRAVFFQICEAPDPRPPSIASLLRSRLVIEQVVTLLDDASSTMEDLMTVEL